MDSQKQALLIEGYASLFAIPDLSGDRVQRGAFSASLHDRGAKGVRMLFQHNASEPVGVWDEMYEDAKGLFVRGRLIADGPRGRTACALVVRGSIDGLSIGFRTGKSTPRIRGRDLHEIDLWEVSIVTFPMLSAARLRVRGYERPSRARHETLAHAG